MMSRNFQTWIAEGEEIYNTLLGEYREIEIQIEEMEARLAAKQAEVNQMASVIGKPPMESTRRLSAQLVEAEVLEPGGATATASANNIARALNGRLGRRAGE
jgi:hypothetical protein